MIRQSIYEDALELLIGQGGAREFLARRTDDGRAWTFSVRIGVRWVPVRSRREPLRTWASLVAVERFALALGVRAFLVEL
ncbi:TPA: hypothetical protein ACPHWC_006278 [Pseudomonas aeruginosa]|uniref:hypothetical protein n=1 Tax=Pseudomonas aeruginosa TaxID=287 RepID=UPI00053D3CC8|nr:hypothetical protein [Pseudomonas aeruginosa]EIU5460344.1 hypothetical protein [Pseudomonas aeruginosa]EIU5543727.1 hypothetical protein [Pseudomonas aeruginosa]EKW4494317.1 hypothetical protein [Pseudomonas aeruginosa]EKY0078636.1 hypothetical protein [Pseudomonas aeruginosa]EKY0500331.1 hypothetical protein [Pseudomonas aeruginosa]